MVLIPSELIFWFIKSSVWSVVLCDSPSDITRHPPSANFICVQSRVLILHCRNAALASSVDFGRSNILTDTAAARALVTGVQKVFVFLPSSL